MPCIALTEPRALQSSTARLISRTVLKKFMSVKVTLKTILSSRLVIRPYHRSARYSFSLILTTLNSSVFAFFIYTIFSKDQIFRFHPHCHTTDGKTKSSREGYFLASFSVERGSIKQ